MTLDDLNSRYALHCTKHASFRARAPPKASILRGSRGPDPCKNCIARNGREGWKKENGAGGKGGGGKGGGEKEWGGKE